MGLDVYLYRYENQSESKKKEEQYEAYSKAIWERGYKTYSQPEKDEIRQKEKTFAESLGLDEWGEDKTTKECIEINSSKYPEHYFKIGYMRSSYNEGGINRILTNLGIDDLYKIFNVGKEYCFAPDWNKSLKNVRRVLKQLKSKPNYRCEKFAWNQFANPLECKVIDTESAMTAFTEQMSRVHDEAYSNSVGLFHPKEPLKVLGFIHGLDKHFFSEQQLPCTYIIYEGENQWYIEALEIVQETIEYVLSKPDIEKYFLHWSS